jgi:hypothetical protein
VKIRELPDGRRSRVAQAARRSVHRQVCLPPLAPEAHRPLACGALVQRPNGGEAGGPSLVSPHGFRGSFRSWCTARYAPMRSPSLASRTDGRTRRAKAYDREEMLETLREWMEKWVKFLSGAESNVVPLKEGAAYSPPPSPPRRSTHTADDRKSNLLS